MVWQLPIRSNYSVVPGRNQTPLEHTKHKEVFSMNIVEQIVGKELYESAQKSLKKQQATMKPVRRRRRVVKKTILPEERPTKNAISLADRRKLQSSKITELEQIAIDKWDENTKSFEGKFNSIEDLLKYLEQYPATPFSTINKPNAMLMKTRNCGLTIESTTEFNAIIEACKKYFRYELEFTASNSIKMASKYTMREGWGVRYTSKGIPELIIISFNGMWRFQYRGAGKKPTLYGRQAWNQFTTDCEKEGIDLEEIAVPAGDEAEKAKKDVPKPWIQCLSKAYIDHELENVHHIDIHSAHCYYIAEEFPQLKPVIYKYYKLRQQYKAEGDTKAEDKMKQMLVNLSGFSESEFVKFRFSKMAAAAKRGTNARVQAIIDELKAAGRDPLLVNTDGVWYAGDEYHFTDEGDDIGQLHTKHAIKFRIKSNGVYEYIDEEGYHPRERGRTALDTVKKRKDWQWGDIYKSGATVKFWLNTQELKFILHLEVEEQ